MLHVFIIESKTRTWYWGVLSHNRILLSLNAISCAGYLLENIFDIFNSFSPLRCSATIQHTDNVTAVKWKYFVLTLLLAAIVTTTKTHKSNNQLSNNKFVYFQWIILYFSAQYSFCQSFSCGLQHNACFQYPGYALLVKIVLYVFCSYIMFMMTSSNGNIFRVTGHQCGEFTGPRWILRTKASDADLWCFLWSASG